MESKMDFDEEMSSLQIEDLGEYFLQTDLGDSWKGFSLGYADDDGTAAAVAAARQQQLQQHAAKLTADAAGRMSTSSTASSSSGSGWPGGAAQVTSPPLASITEMLRQGGPLQGVSSPRKDFAALFHAITSAKSAAQAEDVAMMDSEAMELGGFSLDQARKPPLAAATGKGALPFGGPYKSAGSGTPSPLCQNIISLEDKPESKDDVLSAPPMVNTFKRTNSTLSAPEDDRGYRKKSREKMRRQEVNVKFDELVDLLGLSNRVRKSAILQEAVSAIKALKREREEMRRDRDRLQQEVSKLATCLQYSHLGSVAAANAALGQGGVAPSAAAAAASTHQLHHSSSSPHLAQMTAGAQAAAPTTHTHPLNVQCVPGSNCFPIGGAFGGFSSAGHAALPAAAATPVSIAPKALKPAPSAAAFKPIAPDPQAKQ